MLEVLVLNMLLMVIAVGSLAVAVLSLLSGQASRDGFDGTFLLLVSLLLTVTFSISPIQAWREGLLRDALADFAGVLKERSQKLRAGRFSGRRKASTGRRPYATA